MTRKPLISGVDTAFDWPDDLAGLLFPIELRRDDAFKPTGTLGSLNRDRFLHELNVNRDLPQQIFNPEQSKNRGVLITRFREDAQLNDLSSPVRDDAQLRLYVDDWLNTGRSPDGVEDPRKRDLTKAPLACWAIRRASEVQPTLEPTRNGLLLRFPTESNRVLMRASENGIRVANRLLTLFLLCDWRNRLAKCRRIECGTYFELKHWNRTYKRGTFCPECSRQSRLEGARSTTANTREVAQRKLYGLAAKRFWRKIKGHPNWHHEPELRAAIVQYLNGRIERDETLKAVYRSGIRRDITVKWLGWGKNRKGIEAAVRAVLQPGR